MAVYNWKNLTLDGKYPSICWNIFTQNTDTPIMRYSPWVMIKVQHLGSLHNQMSLRNYFTIDIPINNLTVRTGYMWDYYSSDVNKLSQK